MTATKRRVFESVFKNTVQISQPTPEIGFTAPGQPFGGPIAFAHDRTQAPESASRAFPLSMGSQADINDQVTWDRSWHIVTSFLTMPLISSGFGFGAETPLPAPSPAFQVALMDVLDPENRLPSAGETEDLTGWYLQQVRYHFLHDVLPILSQASDDSKPEAVLRNCIKVLDKAHSLYLYGLSFIVRQLDASKPGSSKSAVENFRRDLHALVGNSTSARVLVSVKKMLAAKVDIVLGVPVIEAIHRPSSGESNSEDARGELLALVESLHNFGLGGERLKIIFAEVMNEVMSKYVQHTFGRIWSRASPTMEAVNSDTQQSAQDTFVTARSFGDSQNFSSTNNTSRVLRDVNKSSTSQCVKDLCDWIEDHYSTLALQVLGKMETAEVYWNHVEKWKKMSTGRLAGLRTQELFDIVVNWPNSGGALDDLRTAIDTPQRRLQLTDVFLASLKERLLHPGASTLQILRTYISMIWSFHSLDHSKVLLDRVAYPLQVYLCSREDTVKIIIAGLLSDTEDASGAPIEPGGDKLVELAILLNKGSGQLEQRPDEDLDWDDMDWMPDPVDAGPGYRRSKNADVIGTLIGVLGSQEVFIKEFQNIVGDNLLKSDGDFDKEVGYQPIRCCYIFARLVPDTLHRSRSSSYSRRDLAKRRYRAVRS
jgi:anaphase-promoting complex subunit 2